MLARLRVISSEPTSHLQVKQNPGHTRWQPSLPREDDAGESHRARSHRLLALGYKSLRILVVEHDAAVSAKMVIALEKQNFTVDSAADGDQALELAITIDYAAVVLSWELPKINGLCVLKTLRNAGSPVRVLMTSDCRKVNRRIRGLRAGADDFLLKPAAMEELIARIHALMRRPARMLSTLRVDTLELDRLKRQVSRDGTLIPLSKNEFALLELMMRNAETAISRETLMQGAWGYKYAELAGVVDVYVNRLRAKIDGTGARPLIQSVPGVGYRITKSLRQSSVQ